MKRGEAAFAVGGGGKTPSGPADRPTSRSTTALDRSVVEAARGGDREAREDLARHAARVAYPLALQLLGSRDAARDVVQDSLLRLFDTLDRFDPERAVEPWLRQIVRNRAFDFHRQRRLRRHRTLHPPEHDGEIELQVADPTVDVAASTVERQRRRTVFRCLAELSPTQREIVVLRDYQDLSYAEIADILAIPQGTVMSRLHRARRALRSLVQQAMLPPAERSTGPSRRSGDEP